nr:hypothetical protein CFP56_18708 [Quercus suber]
MLRILKLQLDLSLSGFFTGFGGQDDFLFEEEKESKRSGDTIYEEWKSIIRGANCLLQWKKQSYPCLLC